MGPSSTLEADTLDPSVGAVIHLPARAPVLTLAVHPDLERVGDRAVLAELAHVGELVLSRAQPSFLDSGGASRGPLHDPHVSRAPVRLFARGGDVLVDASEVRGGIVVSGAPLTSQRLVTEAELEEGLTLVLSGAVMLVLRSAALVPPGRARHGLEGDSDEIEEIRAAIDLAGKDAESVLLLGESGTGKELVAHAIHRASGRAERSFVAVNAATLTASTAASELFGHSRGAFTGADGSHGGYFGRADGGTLFLDEIGDMPPDVQPMLLRALESGEVTPVGGRAARRVDVRVIAATDRALGDAVEAGAFRTPLLHRLAAHTIPLAPLRERREDILPLFVRFWRRESPRARGADLPIEVATALIGHGWPGNVRELRNVARAYARKGAEALGPGMLERGEPRTAPSAASGPGPRSIDDAMVVAALRRNHFRIGATARDLGIARNTLYKRMERCAGLRRARDLEEREIREALEAHPGDLEAAAGQLEVSARGLQLRVAELGLGARTVPPGR
ncbi:MAG: sigma 54-interacting transcriptional regulator [Sandaracinus sp.]